MSKNGPVPHSLKKLIFESQETGFIDLRLVHGITKLQSPNCINDIRKWPCPIFFEKADFRKSRNQVHWLGIVYGLTKLQWPNCINDIKKWPCPTFFKEPDFRKSRNRVHWFASRTRNNKITETKLHKWYQKMALSHILWRSRFSKVHKPGSFIWDSYTD